ncbi:MAG: hypothetical protein AB2615_20865, partial [Candidatus Thiodiazotropha sp.]
MAPVAQQNTPSPGAGIPTAGAIAIYLDKLCHFIPFVVVGSAALGITRFLIRHYDLSGVKGT